MTKSEDMLHENLYCHKENPNSLFNTVICITLFAILSPKTFRKSQYKHYKLKNFEHKLYKLNNKHTE
jgi:hypothetical protein